MASLYDELDLLLRRLDAPGAPTFTTGDAAFLDAIVALEQRLRDMEADSARSRSGDSLVDLINQAPLSRGERNWLHEVRAVRNAVVHNTDVHVGTDFARATLERLREIASVLDGGEITAGGLMTHAVRTVLPGDPVAKVQELMLGYGFAQVPVCDADGRFLGIVTERSLLELFNAGLERDFPRLPAREAIAAGAAAELPPGASLDEVRDAFHDLAVQAVAITRGGRLAGIVTRGDLVRFVV